MAEPFAIIGLASSVVAFVDFSLKIIAAAKTARDSVHDTLPNVHETELILEDVRQSNSRARQLAARGEICQAERHIIAMATECEQLERELQHLIVRKLKMNGEAKFRAIQGGRLALRMWRKGNDVVDLQHRIFSLDSRIRSNVKMVLDRKTGSETLLKLQALRQSQTELGIAHDFKLDSIQRSILELVQSHQSQSGQLASLKQHLDLLAQESATCPKQSRIIRSLYFPELRRRWSDIANADTFTNAWLFNPTKTNFIQWLRQQGGIYWFSGRAGSGKSTLMKFAAEHDQTTTALREWAGSAQLHTASYYFWNQGYEMQKSQLGLFQSLLYQILRQSPELIVHTCLDARLDHERWEITDLKKAFESLATHSSLPSKFCFFIDGLDEFDGDEEDIIKILSYFSDSTLADIKICASSRPREVFRAFEQSVYSLAVQDFTEDDMKTHVRSRLQMNENFKALEAPQSEYEEIMTEISRQSQCVWLWVFLVTRDLVHAVNRKETLPTLKHILRQFPADLEAYFQHIIERIKPFHRVEMAQIFLITTQEVQPLPLFAFSLLEQENHSSSYAVEANICPIEQDEVSKTEKEWNARIQNRCGDLLVVRHAETHPIFLQSPVDFLHRTVRDFLQDCYYDKLKQVVAVQEGFNPLTSLCRMMLFMLKSVPRVQDFRHSSSLNVIFGLTDELLYYAHEVEKQTPEPETGWSPVADVLDELDRVNCKHAVQARLVGYVRMKLAAELQRLQKHGRPLLDYALRPTRVTVVQMPYHSQRDDPKVDPNMVRLLLESGASPNQKVHLNDGRTVWVLFLLSCYETVTREEASVPMVDAWYKASELLCLHGADAQAELMLYEVDYPLNVAGLLTRVFGTDKALRLQNLMAELGARKGRRWLRRFGFW